MSHFKTIRWRFALLLPVFVAALFITTFSHPLTASADGETYSFTGKGTIACSGGTCTNPVGGGATNLTGGPTTYTGSYVVANNKFGCQYIETITLTLGAKASGGGYSATVKATRTVEQGSCGNAPTVTSPVTVADPNGVGPNGGSKGTPGPPSNGGNGAPTCEGTLGPLGWILCGIFDLVGGATQWILTNIIQPFLVTTPISTDPSDPSYAVWSNFRIYGDIFLIFALLVIVFGQSIGGGLVDAYTAKKVLPRLLIAAILINLSLYVVALLVDITNILGEGIGNLLTQPLRQGGNWSFQISGTQIAGVFSVGLIGLLASAGTVIGVVSALIFGGIATAGAAFMSILFILLPMFLAVIAVFVTLVIRKGIILLLLLISPVAFALYCLPNTEKYFRKWWDALVKTLLVYPIVMAVFAVADLLSVTILNANNVTAKNLQDSNWASTHASSILAVVIAFVAQFLPLFLIPFAFRLAGGLLGQVHNFAMGAKDRVNKLSEGRRQHEQQKFHGQTLQARQRLYSDLQKSASAGNGASRFGKRFLASRIGGYNIEAAMSAERARVGKEVNDQIATGMDDEVRGLTVNKKHAWSKGPMVTAADGRSRSNGWVQEQLDADGNVTSRQFKSLGGRWVQEADVDQGKARWGRNTFAQQAALSYEMRKAQTETELSDLKDNYAAVATGDGGWGMNDQQAGGAWIGSSFEHQNKHLEFKYTDWKSGQMDQSKASGFIKEMYEQRGSYNLAQMSSHTIEQLKEAYNATGNLDDRAKVASITQTFMHELGTGAGGVAGMQGDQPQMGGTGTSGARIASTPGAAHVAERVAELAAMTGVAAAEPRGLHNADHLPDTPTVNQKGHTRT